MSDDDEEFPLQQHLVEPVVATTPNCIVGTISIANQTRKKQQQSKQRERDTEITNRVHRHNNRKGKCKRGKKATCTKKASPPTNHHMEEARLENFDSNNDINFEDGDDDNDSEEYPGAISVPGWQTPSPRTDIDETTTTRNGPTSHERHEAEGNGNYDGDVENGGLPIAAELVVLADVAPVVAEEKPTMSHQEDNVATTSQMKRWLLLGVGLVILIVIITSVVLGVAIGQINKDNYNDNNNDNMDDKIPVGQDPDSSAGGQQEEEASTFSPEVNTERFQAFVSHLGPLVTNDMSVFEDPTTVQFEAMDWLANKDVYLPEIGDLVSMAENDEVASLSVYVERYALTLFLFTTYGLSWIRQTQSICNWGFVKEDGGYETYCDDDGNFIGLLLSDMGLSGTIPSEIGLLQFLRFLYLDENDLTGSIPSELGLCTDLVWFNMQFNHLKGYIPTELFHSTNMASFSVVVNQMTGSIPTEIGMLTELTWLGVLSNEFTGTLPTELGRLTQLTTLVADYNALSGIIPSEMGLLTQLTWLDLSHNKFSGTIPMEFGQLSNLDMLDVSSTDLTGTLDAICDTFLLPSNYLNQSWSDCLGEHPELICSCCTMCCDKFGENCVEQQLNTTAHET